MGTTMETKDKRTSTVLKKHLSMATSIAAISLTTLTTATLAQDTAADVNGSGEIEEVVITGSRIARSGTTTPTPTTTVGAEHIGLTGELSLGEILREVPALTAGVDGQSVGLLTFTPETVGVNLANLRGLGTNRTLVLVNGRRHVGSSPGNAAVDMNAIPTALIERVDVITGGASAVYGADAVTGVINVVLKDRFEGLEANAQYGLSEYGDAAQTSFSLAAGANFDDDRGNVYVNFAYHDENGIRATDREDLRFPRITFRPNPDNTGPDDGIPDNVIVEDVITFGTGSCGGYFGCAALPIDPVTGARSDSNSLYVFSSDGSITNVTGDADPGGSSSLVRLVSPTPYPADTGIQHIRIPVTRFLVNTGISYDIADDHTLFFEGAFARTEAEQGLTSTFDSGSRRFVVHVADNPYLDEDVRTALLSGDNPVETFLLGRSNLDFGGRGNPTNRNLIRTVAGLKGDLGKYNYEVYYQYGQSSLDSVRVNDRIEAHYREAADAVVDPATGLPACRVAVEAVAAGSIASVDDHACRPFNIFGEQSAEDLAGPLSYFDFDAASSGKLTQHVASATISGDLFEAPAGTVGFATGVEYRKEESRFTPSPLNQQGAGFFGVVLSEVAGSFDVFEAYGEVLVPLVRDVTLIKELNVEGAARWADYSISGSAWSWKLSGDWMPHEDLRFRGSYAKSVRAPNIAELFAPGVDNFPFITHPCDKDTITQGTNPANRAANCAAAGYAADFDQATTTPTLRVSGSTDLAPEIAKTLTVGGVVTPSFLPGFALTVDYWHIKLDGGITNLPGNTIAAFCYDSASLNNPFCDAIDYHPDGNIDVVRAPQVNVGRFEASGVDIEGTYSFEGSAIGVAGDFSLNAVATYLGKLETQLSEDSPVDENEGEFGTPKWRGNVRLSYNLDDLTISLNQRYIGSVVPNNGFTEEFRDPSSVGAKWYTNIQARYRFGERTELFGGINNLFSNNPPRYPGLEDGDNVGSLYSNVGTYFYLGAKFKI